MLLHILCSDQYDSFNSQLKANIDGIFVTQIVDMALSQGFTNQLSSELFFNDVIRPWANPLGVDVAIYDHRNIKYGQRLQDIFQ